MECMVVIGGWAVLTDARGNGCCNFSPRASLLVNVKTVVIPFCIFLLGIR